MEHHLERASLIDIIITRETLEDLKVVHDSEIKINIVTMSMQSLSAIQDLRYIMNMYWESLEPESMHKVTKHIVHKW